MDTKVTDNYIKFEKTKQANQKTGAVRLHGAVDKPPHIKGQTEGHTKL